ncbi:RNA 2',3'-cyclic phosphodiesterase [Edaphobacter aggregans]|uniref:RNA 2',3'-cyclic phosphodiesterase n=1 Tax=Edaphobacter aggregans TaxID=570835 RepID=UPI00068DBCE7|nr:RNA 2',3'-cyclic phosphodiesterase [Edaphobacter aggregans]
MSMRLFVGIALAPAVIDELSRMTAKLRHADDGLRWSAPESWHITLQFLGASDRNAYECVIARLGEIHLPPFTVRLDAPGVFERAGVFFVGVHPSPELTALERHVVAATTLCGFTPETRPYHPHITLARTKGRSGNNALRGLKTRLSSAPRFTPSSVDEFLLYESKPTATGSVYEVRERFRLSSPT